LCSWMRVAAAIKSLVSPSESEYDNVSTT
jgi:hypothetical protein